MRSNYMASCAAAALLAAAGSARALPQEGTPGAPVASSAPAPETDEIIVTAQRRPESVQNVPATVQALTGQTLSQLNVTSFDDLVRFCPT